MKIAICDDNAQYREQIAAIVTEFAQPRHRDVSLSVYEHPTALLDDVTRFGGFDIYILDIVMPVVDGVQLGVQLRRCDAQGKIIFLTSSQEYALDSYRARAFDYILKPVKKERLIAALEEAAGTIPNRKDKSILVKSRESTVKLTYDSILYAELADRKIRYRTIGGNTIEGSSIRVTFSDAVAELLNDDRFVLCGPGLAVNLYYITMVNNDSLIFKNGLQLYVGKRAGKELRTVWFDFWMNKEERL